MPKAKGGARNEYFSDKEILWFIYESTGNEGWASSADVLSRMRKLITSERPIQNVAIRLSWMKRFGFIEKRREAGETLWRITPRGEVYRTGALDKALSKELGGLSGGELLDAMQAIARRSLKDKLSLTAVRRQYRHSTFIR